MLPYTLTNRRVVVRLIIYMLKFILIFVFVFNTKIRFSCHTQLHIAPSSFGLLLTIFLYILVAQHFFFYFLSSKWFVSDVQIAIHLNHEMAISHLYRCEEKKNEMMVLLKKIIFIYLKLSLLLNKKMVSWWYCHCKMNAKSQFSSKFVPLHLTWNLSPLLC